MSGEPIKVVRRKAKSSSSPSSGTTPAKTKKRVRKSSGSSGSGNAPDLSPTSHQSSSSQPQPPTPGYDATVDLSARDVPRIITTEIQNNPYCYPQNVYGNDAYLYGNYPTTHPMSGYGEPSPHSALSPTYTFDDPYQNAYQPIPTPYWTPMTSTFPYSVTGYPHYSTTVPRQASPPRHPTPPGQVQVQAQVQTRRSPTPPAPPKTAKPAKAPVARRKKAAHPLRESSTTNVNVKSSKQNARVPTPEDVPTGATTYIKDYFAEKHSFPVHLKDRLKPSPDQGPHYWWDVRNLEDWTDFNYTTIMSLPNIDSLINRELFSSTRLPVPAVQTDMRPISNETELRDAFLQSIGSRVNSASTVTILQDTPKMTCGPLDHASLVSRDSNDQIRAVGVILLSDFWQSAHRTGNKVERQGYLQGLSLLHRYMRQNGCRYGYIMNEKELVFARNGTEKVPYFGHLQLSSPVPMSSTRSDGMNACLALWFLHVLIQRSSFQGYPSPRISVGRPEDVTRMKVMNNMQVRPQAWADLVAPSEKLKRRSKTFRGWIMPTDSFKQPKNKTSRRSVFW